MIDPDRLQRAYETAREDLLAERTPDGHWVGELSASALSTATAISALSLVSRCTEDMAGDGVPSERFVPLIASGLRYLADCQNPDGGWGDTDKSLSNIATTMLVRAAFHLAGKAGEHRELLDGAQRYIDSRGGLSGLRKRYGRDKTFAVPILTNCALAGLVRWREVSPLPFELACFPRAVFRFLRLRVVSYALPALVAVGQARYFHAPPRNPITRLVRRLAVERSLRTLGRMQPDSGGYLEATPLTSFVVMSLAGSGRVDHPVVERGVEFLVQSVRADGSWPIDTNLATWLTTLSVNALAGTEEVSKLGCLDWLLSCQQREVHPYTDADPGGWGWTDLSGAVPDADDTPGALLALAAMRSSATEEEALRLVAAAECGVRWLLGLQNSDGGWPTFCRGWGKLPFDRSGVDLTAHAIRALDAWKNVLPGPIRAAVRRGFSFLQRSQRGDGSWVPLWFGNQHQPDEENPVYGTSRVLLAYRDLDRLASDPARRGLAWLAQNQRPDGGWGGGPAGSDQASGETSSVEETAVATEALIGALPALPAPWFPSSSLGTDVCPSIAPKREVPKLELGNQGKLGNEGMGALPKESLEPVVAKGLTWLVESVESGRFRENAPIGFYFAKLWYHEKLYPLIFTVSALARATHRIGCRCVSGPDSVERLSH